MCPDWQNLVLHTKINVIYGLTLYSIFSRFEMGMYDFFTSLYMIFKEKKAMIADELF